jgi:flagellar hook assembly protein FlgD
VELGIYDLAGRQVRSHVSRSEEAGVHQVQWDGRDDAGHGVARGVYFARLRLGPETLHRTLVLIQ